MVVMQKQHFRFVDLFAGIGGMRLGLELVGGSCVYSVELDGFARRTYAANFGRCEGEDIRDVDRLPAHEVLAAGFPCQPFSIAGVSKKLSLGREHGFLDQTQGTLFFELARLIKSSRPPVVLLENVKNLVRHNKGETFRVIMSTLENDLGYSVSWSIIDAQPWVPQHRERLFIVGLRKDVFGEQVFRFDQVPRRSHALSEVLGPYDPKYVLSRHLWKYLRDYAAKHRAKGNGFGFGLVGPDDVARTLSARYHKDGSEILIRTRRGQPPRRLTPRECALLMGFPRRFRIVVSDTQAYRQFGNAVVPAVVAHVGKALASQVEFPRVRPSQLPLAL
jgi:DNA (cytosine-5)-methyltransferase 1